MLLLLGALRAALGGRQALVLENLLLRQQLAVALRARPRPRLRRRDRVFWVVARHLCAKHGVGEGPLEQWRSEKLRETLRRGLVAFVGAEQARALADRCLGGPPKAA